MTAEEYADNKYTPKAKEYAQTSSIKAVYDNCIVDFNAGVNSVDRIKIDTIKLLMEKWALLELVTVLKKGTERADRAQRRKTRIYTLLNHLMDNYNL
jgi:hypothetical protein